MLVRMGMYHVHDLHRWEKEGYDACVFCVWIVDAVGKDVWNTFVIVY